MTRERVRSSISPTLGYHDAPAAIQWLVDTLGFEVTALYQRDNGVIAYAQLAWGDGCVNVSSREPEQRFPVTGRSSTYLAAPSRSSVDEYFERARGAGATILRPVEDNFTGNHAFTLEDPEGNLWNVGIAWLETEEAQSLPEKRV